MNFRIEGGDSVDPLVHTQQILDQYPDTKIYIGSDSQNKRKHCIYAIVIAYRFSYDENGLRKGARYIYRTEEVGKTKDKFTRLWGEVERSVELALFLEANGFKVHKIDLDFNQKSNTGSHDLVASGTGYVIGQGFDCTVKPDEQISSRAADHIVKKKSSTRRFYFKKKKRKT